MDENFLVKKAIEMRDFSYVPYSKFSVGAALLCDDGAVYTGCNIENAAYSVTVCAERTAFFKAVSEGKKGFSAIAISGGKKGKEAENYAYPCGVCRQVMREFCNPDTFTIYVAKSETEVKVFKLKDLLPDGFGPENL